MRDRADSQNGGKPSANPGLIARRHGGGKWLALGSVLALTLGVSCTTTAPKPDTAPVNPTNGTTVAPTPGTAPVPAETTPTPPAAGETTGQAAPATNAATSPAANPEPPAAAPANESAPEVPPGNSDEAFKAGVTALDRGVSGYDDALNHFKSVLAGDSKSVEALFDKGIVHTKKGELKEAEKAFRRVTELRPKFNGGWANLADVYRREKDFPKALETLDEGLKVIPGDALLLNNRAFVFRQEGKTTESIEEVRKILKVNAIDVNAFNNMGRTYLELKDYDMALVIFLKALQTAPGAEKDAWIHNNLGLTYLGMKDPRAAGEFDRALELDSKLFESLICRAYLHLELQEYEKAADLLRKAVAQNPTDVATKLDLGVALRGLKEYDRAEMQYQEALKLAPKNPQVLLNYGILMGDYVKNYPKAIDLYTQLKEASAPGPDQERAEKLVKEATRNEERRKKKAESKAAKPEPKPGEGTAATPAPDGAAPAPAGTTPANPPGQTGAGTGAPSGTTTPAQGGSK